MNRVKLTLWICTLLSALFLSLPWLIPHCGGFALVGFVPLLFAEYVAYRNSMKRFRLWHYSCFVLWNAFTTWWIWNATAGGAVFAILANALQMSLLFGLFRLSRKVFGGILPYIFLALAWIAWERWYLQSAEISWPWLVLGNAFAQSTGSIQWYEYTGTLGGSLWVWASNISIFYLIKSFIEGNLGRVRPLARYAAFAWLAAVLILPFGISALIYRNCEAEDVRSVEVLIAQPDFDPYHKFESMSQAEQNEVLLQLYEDSLAGDGSWQGLLLAPETFTGDVFLNEVQECASWKTFNAFLQRYPRANLLFGASTYRYHDTREAPTILCRQYGAGWMESFNSALLTDASGRTEVFHKSKLVVGTEQTPFPKIFVPLDNKLGGVMGRCSTQKEVSALHFSSDSLAFPLGCAVCYESVYGEYCTDYVRRGAELLAVITNDAWWGDTPGYRQHLSYSRLRAIELRRDVARCANTGISAIINKRGDIVDSTPWWEKTVLRGKISLGSEQTFFVRHGDMTGRAATFSFLLLLLAGAVRLLRRK